MGFLEAKNLSMYMKDRKLIDVTNLRLHEGNRIGLVGRNGSGKTTLMKILAGEIVPETGHIVTDGTRHLLPQLKRTNTTKSGGEITQEYIDKALAKKADIFFLDEPTTNLDTTRIEKLEKQLKKWKGILVIVSHDRAFLDNICTKIWELQDGKVSEYKGNYSDYYKQKQQEIRQQEQAYESYIKKKSQLEEALELKEQKAQRATKKPKHTSNSEAKITGAKPYYANKQKKLRKSAKAIETRLEKLDKVEKVKEIPPIKMKLPNEEGTKGRIILRVEEVAGKVGDRLLWNNVSFQIRGGDKLAIIGPNGSGKTTLIKKIINQEDQIQSSPAMKIGYFSQNLDVLDINKTILENVSDTSSQDEALIRTVLARLHFYREDVYKEIKVLSGGERVKVAFAKLFVSNVNTIILDEPTNFLDIDAVEALEQLLTDYEGTVLFVSHDRRFIQEIANRIIVFENHQINLFEGTYAAYKNDTKKQKEDPFEQELIVLETKITETLSKLSMEPTEALDQEFESLLARKKELESKRSN
ncbi:Vga family ABC-F type ribosomal protection protein [Virgibacillus salexigens]|uniref:ABC-F type ribosomal protection protein n=1 Tax=Virgibacillus kapii TaxID=1638645 RepID=A0ABQ2DUB1_9BACI|nr:MULTISPECIES: Vga family ABC-F type ribosomal protection protein [Virgibacillus]MYL43401.1 Vga family ABC-F type ribosomal protection protein [Virgibacillus massiliensis]GGJ68529.1 ABC-F type ribosomal protection protein [Virgibacillus kapii]